mmetsp:Transcript_86683/g.250340  ORF Transcript_86683/g.250340 Transcript_86683/m.250340 type:complete len:280 (+) Transcript_86683:1043-1882(+)
MHAGAQVLLQGSADHALLGHAQRLCGGAREARAREARPHQGEPCEPGHRDVGAGVCQGAIGEPPRGRPHEFVLPHLHSGRHRLLRHTEGRPPLGHDLRFGWDEICGDPRQPLSDRARAGADEVPEAGGGVFARHRSRGPRVGLELRRHGGQLSVAGRRLEVHPPRGPDGAHGQERQGGDNIYPRRVREGETVGQAVLQQGQLQGPEADGRCRVHRDMVQGDRGHGGGHFGYRGGGDIRERVAVGGHPRRQVRELAKAQGRDPRETSEDLVHDQQGEGRA